MADTAPEAKPRYATRMAPAERREQLLDVVLQVIVKQGVHKVSMDTVAKEAGVTRPVVYSFFTDTNDLLRASLAREEAAATHQIMGILTVDPEGDPSAAATDALRRFLTAVLEAPDRWRAIFTLVDSSTKQFRARVEHGQQMAIATIQQMITSSITPEAASHADADLLARTIFSLYWDSGRLILSDPATYSIERLVAHAVYVITRCLR